MPRAKTRYNRNVRLPVPVEVRNRYPTVSSAPCLLIRCCLECPVAFAQQHLDEGDASVADCEIQSRRYLELRP